MIIKNNKFHLRRFLQLKKESEYQMQYHTHTKYIMNRHNLQKRMMMMMMIHKSCYIVFQCAMKWYFNFMIIFHGVSSSSSCLHSLLFIHNLLLKCNWQRGSLVLNSNFIKNEVIAREMRHNRCMEINMCNFCATLHINLSLPF